MSAADHTDAVPDQAGQSGKPSGEDPIIHEGVRKYPFPHIPFQLSAPKACRPPKFHTIQLTGINFQRQPGLMVSPKDHAPTFHAQTLEPGSAPKKNTFQPQPAGEVPGQADNEDMETDTRTSASATLGGATSANVDKGFGRPVQGQSSDELRHGGQHGGKKQGLGLAGQQTTPSTNDPANPREDERQRALDKEEAVIPRGDKPDRAAEDLPPSSA